MKKLTFLVAALCATMALNAAEVVTSVATCNSADVVDKSAYTAYENDAWSVSVGGNNKSFGFNKSNIKKLPNAYGTAASTANSGFTVVSKNALSKVNRVVFSYGSNSGACGKLYLAYSVDGSTWQEVALATTSPNAQGADLTKTAMQFDFNAEIASAYYAFVFDAGKTISGAAYRFDDVVIELQNVEIQVVAVEDPKFSVSEGVYLSSQSVQLTCVTDGASIYYTLDGSDPDDTKTLYESAISVSESTTIKAIAIKGAEKSNIVSAKYTIIHNDGTEAKPFTCADVLALQVSSESVWVEGYIIGAMKSDGSVIDNTVATNLAIAGTSTENDVANMVSVQLPSGSIRTALNVKDNASNIGKKVQVYGKIEAYLNHAGVKSVTDYKIEGSTTALESVEMSNIYANNGRIYGAEQGRIYTINGMDVTEQNGQLSNGIYIVKVGATATKIAVK